MRYKVEFHEHAWTLYDTGHEYPRPLIWISKLFPDAEYLIRSQALFLNESPAYTDDFPFSEGQRIYKRGTGIRGTFVIHNGHPAVRLDGDSCATGLTIFEWQAE